MRNLKCNKCDSDRFSGFSFVPTEDGEESVTVIIDSDKNFVETACIDPEIGDVTEIDNVDGPYECAECGAEVQYA